MSDIVEVLLADPAGLVEVITAGPAGAAGAAGTNGADGAAGAPGAPSASDSALLTVGEETFSRISARDTTLSLTSQRVLLGYFTARKSETVTQVRVICGSTAAGATPTTVLIGVYTVAGNGDLTRVAVTTNDTAVFAATNTPYTKSFTASFSKVAGTRYAVGILVVTAAAVPTTVGIFGGGGNAAEVGLDPRLAGAVTGQSTMPASIANASITTTSNVPYIVLLP